jgi:hypothetical protein
MEISEVSDKNAARMIVETPVDGKYCSARQNIQAQLKQHGFRLDSQHGCELPQALAVDVVGNGLRRAGEDRPGAAGAGATPQSKSASRSNGYPGAGRTGACAQGTDQHARGLTKSYGERLRGCSPRKMNRELAQEPGDSECLAAIAGWGRIAERAHPEYNDRVKKRPGKSPRGGTAGTGEGSGNPDCPDLRADPAAQLGLGLIFQYPPVLRGHGRGVGCALVTTNWRHRQ